MANKRSHHQDFDDEFDDDFDNDEDDFEPANDERDGFDDTEPDDIEPTIPCPYCGRQIHEDAPRCHHCDCYISQEDSPAERRPWWIYLGVVLCLYAVLRWFF